MNRSDILFGLANNHQWGQGAELGVKDGRTLFRLLDKCPALKMYGVDLWAPTPSYADWDHDRNYEIVRERAEAYASRVALLKMSTDEAAEVVHDGSLDFVFIDADHSTESVRSDIKNWTPKLKPSGWLMGHDIDWPSVREAVADLKYGVMGDNVWYANSLMRLSA